MNKVEIKEFANVHDNARPFTVWVNGEILRDKRGVGRSFASSINAAIAGSKEVDRLKALNENKPSFPLDF